MKKIFFSIVILASGFATTVCAQESKSEKNNSCLILTDWMQLHCHLVRNTKGIVHVAYSRHFSYTAIAVYQSIVGSNKNYRSLQGQLNGLKEFPTAKGKLFWSKASMQLMLICCGIFMVNLVFAQHQLIRWKQQKGRAF